MKGIRYLVHDDGATSVVDLDLPNDAGLHAFRFRVC